MLQNWQSENSQEQLPKLEEAFDEGSEIDVSNDLTRLGCQDDFRARSQPDDEDETSIPSVAEGFDEEDEAIRRQYLQRGDLVELP